METLSLNSILERRGGEKRVEYGLDRFRSALKTAGHPEADVHTLVIGGTNGKGTTSLLVSSALCCAGFRVVTYLSPHLVSPSERILDNLAPVDELPLAELAEELSPLAEAHELTYFELLTLMVLVWARRVKADFLVLEVGLGGRLDATNVTDPLACAITNISFDHQEYLGHTLESILGEKLGIVRPEGLLFTGIEDPKLLGQLEKHCLDLDAVYYLSKEIAVHRESIGWNGQRVTLNGFPFELSNPSVGTARNAALAFLMLRIVFPRLSIGVLQEGFRRVRTPGRLEVVAERPRVVLSGDHNPGGIACLEETLADLPPTRLKIVCGFSPDKPYVEMYEALRKLSDDILLTQVTRLRGQMPEGYRHLGPFCEDPKEAVRRMMASCGADETLLVTGSLYLVGEVRPLWHETTRFVSEPAAAR